MRHLEPVIWTKGTVLHPQHLQNQDRFLEEILRFHIHALTFRPWGFSRLSIDESALASGTFEVPEGSGIFPDGLLFDFPTSEAGPPARSLIDAFDGDQETVDVFLTVPRWREMGINISDGEPDNEARYRAEFMMVRDENTGLSEKPVQVARKNIRILLEGEGAVFGEGRKPMDGVEGRSVLRVARIRRKGASGYQLDSRFVPPLLDVAASKHLVFLTRRLIEILTSRSSELSGARRQKNQTLADFSAADIARFWLLYSINTHFPVVRRLLQAGGHPEALYSALLALAGALTTFSSKIQPNDLPPYDHDDLGTCFTNLDEKLRLLLQTVVQSNFVSLLLKPGERWVHSTPLDDERLIHNTRMFLAIACDLKKTDTATKVPHLVKVCSASHIEYLLNGANPGVVLEHERNAPPGLPVKLDYEYFSLRRGGSAWESIMRARNFAAYIPAEFPNPRAELLILLPEPSGG